MPAMRSMSLGVITCLPTCPREQWCTERRHLTLRDTFR